MRHIQTNEAYTHADASPFNKAFALLFLNRRVLQEQRLIGR